MTDKQLPHPPDKPKLETAVAVAKGLVGLIPAGGLIGELANRLNPLEKRKQAWLVQVADAINEIQDRFEILPEQLWSDERFISFAWEASLIALKNHRHEKLSALKVAIVSMTGMNTSEEDVAFQFLRYIDELTVTHINILVCINSNAQKYRGISQVEKILSITESILGESLDRGSFKSFLTDLERMYLIRSHDLEDLPEDGPKGPDYLITEGRGFSGVMITLHGVKFLTFINDTRD